MELIDDYNNFTNNYTQKIKITKYTEGENITIEKEGVKDICEIIISHNDHIYNTVQKNHRDNFITNKKLQIADEVQKNEKYNRKFNPKVIQRGLQNKNHLSSILYMNELYKINTVIYNGSNNKFYKTSLMEYPILLCEYKNNSWHDLENKEYIDDSQFHSLEELSEIITLDCEQMIHKSPLQSISKYKFKDLEQLCKDANIDIMYSSPHEGKKKLKKDLYNDLTTHIIRSS